MMQRSDPSNREPGRTEQRGVEEPAAAKDDVILNPRRSPRLRVCCASQLTSGGRTWTAHTEDVGPRGCQLVSSLPVPVGAPVDLVLSSTSVADLAVSGSVVWASPAPPFRVGVAFSERHAGATSRWFDDLVSTGGAPRVERYVRGIPADTTLFLGAPPRYCPDFTPDEAAMILSIGAGLRAGELRDRFHSSWSQSRHALFSLITRRVVTTSPAEAVPVARWRAFHEYLAALAAEQRRRVEPPAPAPAPLPVPARPADAQALYDAALLLIANGRTSSAIDTLRAGLARAPGDAEIAAALLRLAVGANGASQGRGGLRSP